MLIPYKPFGDRQPDWQYHDNLRHVLQNGIRAGNLPQGKDALTCFGTLKQMVFDPLNGVPLITERDISKSWRSAVAEIIAFINGARTIDAIESFGVNKTFWSPYRGKGTELGLEADDMGPGSYGAVFHDFECGDGTTFNQFANLLEQIRNFPSLRTFKITNWHPRHTARGPHRKVIVAPCHGEIHVRILDKKLHLIMNQRSGDFPIGVPHNMIQYAALHLMLCQVLGYLPGNYIHGFLGDAHIYENQVEYVRILLEREPKPFPTLRITDPSITDLFAFRAEHFVLEEYEPHPRLNIPFAA